jgi:hypothetical protein
MPNNPPVVRPDKEFKLVSGKTLKMTYVVFNDILRFVGTIDEAFTSIMTNQDVRDLIIRRLLTDYNKPINDLENLIELEKVDEELDIFEMDDLLAWTMEHVTYFFMRTATKMHESASKFPEVAAKMKMSSDLSETGLTASQTQTKSAGPTE